MFASGDDNILTFTVTGQVDLLDLERNGTGNGAEHPDRERTSSGTVLAQTLHTCLDGQLAAKEAFGEMRRMFPGDDERGAPEEQRGTAGDEQRPLSTMPPKPTDTCEDELPDIVSPVKTRPVLSSSDDEDSMFLIPRPRPTVHQLEEGRPLPQEGISPGTADEFIGCSGIEYPPCPSPATPDTPDTPKALGAYRGVRNSSMVCMPGEYASNCYNFIRFIR